jgi:hypothetical protein
MTTHLRAAVYLGVSTGRQADNDLSFPDQRRQAHARIVRAGGGRSLPSSWSPGGRRLTIGGPSSKG